MPRHQDFAWHRGAIGIPVPLASAPVGTEVPIGIGTIGIAAPIGAETDANLGLKLWYRFVRILHRSTEMNQGNINLWGREKGRQFVKKNLYVGMYQDVKGRAWNYLADDCYSWLKLAGSSLRTNYQRIRRKLHDLIIVNWIKYGDVNEWDRNYARIEKYAKNNLMKLFWY